MKPRQSAVVLAVSMLVLAGLLALFAVELSNSQAQQRRQLHNRFSGRAQITSSLTSALFSSAATSAGQQNARLYGGATIKSSALSSQASKGRLAYLAVLDNRGAVIAASPSMTPAARMRLAGSPADVQAVLVGRPYSLSDVLQVGAGGGQVIELAEPFSTPSGKRILVSGFVPQLLAAFMNGYLAGLPKTADSRDYVLDSHGLVVGASVPSVTPGRPVAEGGLQVATAHASEGVVEGGRYVVSTPVQDSSWRVVASAANNQLLAPVLGANRWVPWVLLAAFAMAGVGALLLLRRVLAGAAALTTANVRLGDVNARLERTNLTLKNRASELARSNAELEQFASIASHDLQEPLRKVQTFAGQLSAREADRLSEQGQEYIRRMGDAAGRMQVLIEDLLRFARVSTHGRAFVPVDLEQVAREVLDDLEAIVDETGADITVGPLPTIRADPLQMRQLLQNLMSNALKFRRPGVTPEVRLGARVHDGVAEISVSDNGIGFDARYATRIFRVFERLNGRSEYPGTGIGLALSRKIAERHGGSVLADSVPAQGSLFIVTLPVQHVDGELPFVAVPSAEDEVPVGSV